MQMGTDYSENRGADRDGVDKIERALGRKKYPDPPEPGKSTDYYIDWHNKFDEKFGKKPGKKPVKKGGK